VGCWVSLRFNSYVNGSYNFSVLVAFLEKCIHVDRFFRAIQTQISWTKSGGYAERPQMQLGLTGSNFLGVKGRKDLLYMSGP
jgi:hypothetical protein